MYIKYSVSSVSNRGRWLSVTILFSSEEKQLQALFGRVKVKFMKNFWKSKIVLVIIAIVSINFFLLKSFHVPINLQTYLCKNVQLSVISKRYLNFILAWNIQKWPLQRRMRLQVPLSLSQCALLLPKNVFLFPELSFSFPELPFYFPELFFCFLELPFCFPELPFLFSKMPCL